MFVTLIVFNFKLKYIAGVSFYTPLFKIHYKNIFNPIFLLCTYYCIFLITVSVIL